MKSTGALLCTLMLALLLCACGGVPDEAPSAPSDETETVTISSMDPDGTLGEEPVTVPADVRNADTEGAKLLADTLREKGILRADVEVLQFSAENGAAKLDLNAAFQQQLLSVGTTGELQLLTAVVNTFLDCYSCDTILLTVGGEPLRTGHMIYDKPLTRFAA